MGTSEPVALTWTGEGNFSLLTSAAGLAISAGAPSLAYKVSLDFFSAGSGG